MKRDSIYRRSCVVFVLSFFLLLFFGVSSVSAQEGAGFAQAAHDKGSVKLGLSGSLSVKSTDTEPEGGGLTSTTNTTAVTLAGNVGYFLTDGLELSYATFGTVIQTDPEGANNTSTIGVFSYLAQARYYFVNPSTFTPYVGAQLGFTTLNIESGSFSTSATGVSLGGMLGADMMLSEKTALFLEWNLLYSKIDTDFGDTKTVDSTIFVGFNYFF